jgi:Lipopolysaccharide kinase (Kdo/WaaP) family
MKKPDTSRKPSPKKPSKSAKPSPKKPAKSAKPSPKKPAKTAKPSPKKPAKTAKPSPKKPAKSKKPVAKTFEKGKPAGPFDAGIKCQPGDKRCSLVDIVNDEKIANYIFYNNEKQCAYYKKGDRMGQPSLYGSIYYTCCDEKNKPPKNCKHITKIVKFNNGQDFLNFQTEIAAHQLAAKAGLAPSIVKVYLTQKQGIIIMQKMKETLNELMNRNLVIFAMQKMPEARVREIARGWASEIGTLFVKLHKLGMLHNDAHTNNFMTDDKGKFYMIDFGRSGARHYKEIIKNELVGLCDAPHGKSSYSTGDCPGVLEYEYRQLEWAESLKNKFSPTDIRYAALDEYIKRLTEIKNMEIGQYKNGTLVL